jgi:hypothetical protein
VRTNDQNEQLRNITSLIFGLEKPKKNANNDRFTTIFMELCEKHDQNIKICATVIFGRCDATKNDSFTIWLGVAEKNS